ncbi:MAG: metal ABC transporter permease [Acidimicrobiia bacterium]|nr:metal ABC transporter permease [Acidimicrobiia bacterium]
MSRLPSVSTRLAAFVAVILTACASTGPASEVEVAASPFSGGVLVTTSIWADVVDNVTCSPAGTFEPLIPAGADPHGYRPSIADAEAMREASVIIANGGGLEEPLEPLVDQAEADGVTVIRLTDAVDAGGDDPHLWLDPTLTIEATRVLADVLPAGAGNGDATNDAGVTECADRYIATLEDLDAELADQVAILDRDRRKLVTNHDALGRFADRYGFEVIGTVLPSTSSMAQANPADLEALAGLIAAEDVPAIFTEGGHEGEDAEALADRLGVDAVGLQTDALGPEGSGYQTYVELMRTNTELIVAALGDDQSSTAANPVTDPVGWWISPFTTSSIMRQALLAGLLVVLTTSVVGTWVVLRGMSFLGDALAHGVLPGVAVAFLLGVSTTIGALAAALLMVGALTLLREHSPMAEDVSIGVLFVGFLASAVVILSSGSDQYVGDLNRFLFGSILAIDEGDLARQAVASVIVLAGVVVFHRSFVTLTFDRQLAQLLGLRPGLAHAVLLVLVMIAIVASFEAVGNLLVFAFLVAPPATAALLVKRVPVIMGASVVFGAVAVVVGLLIAYHNRTAAEATMALVAVVLFLAAVSLGVVRGRSPGRPRLI